MKIVAVKKEDDCHVDSGIYNYIFSHRFNNERILNLKEIGELEYFEDFPRPFWRVTTPAGVQIKGVEGEKNCKVVFPSDNRERLKAAFENHFDYRRVS